MFPVQLGTRKDPETEGNKIYEIWHSKADWQNLPASWIVCIYYEFLVHCSKFSEN